MKTAQVDHVPEGYHTLTPTLTIKGAKAAMEFYRQAFGARILHAMETPDGSIMHAAMVIGDSQFMLSDEMSAWGVLSPRTLGGTPVGIYMYVKDADATFAQAIAAGGEETRPVTTEFWGDRAGQFLDPFGHKWTVATRVEEVSIEETMRRGEELMQKMARPE